MERKMMTGTYIRGEETLNFNFYTDLKIADKLRFVNSVVNLLVSDENYNYILRNLVFDFYLIDIMTSFDTTELRNSVNFLDSVEDFLEDTNIVDIVKANMEEGLLEELNHAIDLNIEYKTGIHPSPINEALASLVNTFEKKINEIDLSGMEELAQAFSGMNGDFNLENIPENIVKAYMDSDIAKKNANEVAESKKRKKSSAKKLSKVVDITDNN